MTRRAYSVGSAVIGREPRVIKHRSLPSGRGVAGRAGRRESCGCVIRIGRALIVGFVARVAIRGHSRVVVVHMAIGASHGGVRTGQRKCRVVVIEA